MSNKFTQSIKFVLQAEGGYVNDPVDPGGETNYGIAKRSHPEVDIKNLTVEKAIQIYFKEYWTVYNIEKWDMPFCIAVLDSYVQHRPSTAAQMVELANGNLQVLLEARRQFYLKLIGKKAEMVRFKKGWMNRINELGKYCDIIMQ